MKSKILFLSLLLSFCLFTNLLFAQDFGPSSIENTEEVFSDFPQTQSSAMDSLMVWQEKVFLHLDKDAVKPKDRLFFKAYVLTGQEELRVSISDVLRVELLDMKGNLLADQYHKIEEGMANGTLELPKKLKPGKYYLRAYTRWMLNYGAESLPVAEVTVPGSNRNGDQRTGMVNIIPEGGHFVVGIENKGVISNPKGYEINGQIIDDMGNDVASAVNYGDGLATFSFVPEVDQKYYWQENNGNKTALPESLTEGMVLQVNNINDNKIKVRIRATKGLRGDTYYLRGSKNGREFLNSGVIFEKGKDFVELDIPKEGLPHGVFNLTLRDALGQVWAERPIFIEAKDLLLTLTEEPYNINKNQQGVRYRIKVTDELGNPVSTDVSLSVKSAKNITGTEPLSHEKRGQNFLSDLKVLANRPLNGMGSTAERKMPNEIKYAFQNGLEFYGQAYDFNNTLLKNKKIQIFINNANEVEVKEVSTNSNGLFTLTGLQLEGEVTLTFRRDGKDTMEKLVKVIPYEYELPQLKVGESPQLKIPKRVPKSGQLIPQKRLSDFTFKDVPSNLIPLEEVTLVGKRELSKPETSVYNITPSYVVYQDVGKPKSIAQLLLDVPGAMVSNMGDIANESFRLPMSYGGGPSLWVVDGIPLQRDPEMTNLADIMSVVSMLDVERIEVLRAVDAGAYGSRAGGGVVVVYTKNGAYSSEHIARKDAQYNYKGFEQSVVFKDYLASKEYQRNKDGNLITLYWNPTLRTDGNGEAMLQIPLTEGTSNIVLDAKVITEDGKRGALKSLSQL